MAGGTCLSRAGNGLTYAGAGKAVGVDASLRPIGSAVGRTDALCVLRHTDDDAALSTAAEQSSMARSGDC